MEFDELLEHLDDLVDLAAALDFNTFAAHLALLRLSIAANVDVCSRRGPLTADGHAVIQQWLASR